MKKNIKETFHKHGLRSTACRKEVLQVFLERQKVLSQPDLEKELGNKFDRVTLYRTLKAFIQNGILHKVVDEGEVSLYGLCRGCDSGEHYDDHLHFKCIKCQKTQCLQSRIIPEIKLPKGFVALKHSFLITGFCKECNQ